MSDLVDDIWAYCTECRRWFACPGWFDRQVPQPTCPVCAQEPSAIENRALVLTGHPPDRQTRQAGGGTAGTDVLDVCWAPGGYSPSEGRC